LILLAAAGGIAYAGLSGGSQAPQAASVTVVTARLPPVVGASKATPNASRGSAIHIPYSEVVLATTILSGDGSFQQLIGHRPYAVAEADPWSDVTSPTRGVHLTLGFAKPLSGITGWYPALNYAFQDSVPTKSWLHLRLLAVKHMSVDVDLRLRTVEWLTPMPNDISATAEWFDPSTGPRGNITTKLPAHAVP
jgi:hypothetical protein